MTQEEKQLLLKDLCARLPYGVRCYVYQYKIDGNDCECQGKLIGINDGYFYLADRVSINGGKTYDGRYLEAKPYLRPMSSMTKEEEEEYNGFLLDVEYYPGKYFVVPATSVVDWLLSHHFDYRGLIEKGLALEAPEGMYKTE